MTPILLPRPYTDARAIWPDLRTRLAALAERTNEPWMVEDVFHLIAMGQARLWASADLAAFIVTQVDVQPWGSTMVIWIGSEETTARASDYMDQLHAIATDLGCDRVSFSSPRRWERALPGLTVRHDYSFDVRGAS